MKKILSLILAGVMMLSLAACGGNETTNETTLPSNETTAPVETTLPENNDTTEDAGDVDATDAPVASTSGALTVLESIWNLYAEDEKFSVMGGNVESGIMGAPGNYDMAYAENLTYNLIVPAENLASIDEAATVIHMMNANTFTSGVVHLTEGTDVAAFVETMKTAIKGNQWMCGFPETMIIAVVDESYVVIAFGASDLLSVFESHLTEAYAEAQILVNEFVEG